MEYKDVRKKFVELSGRYDLVKMTGEDDGADFFLNAGQKFLDRLLDTGKMNARYPVLLTAGTIVAKTIGLRAIKEVWASNSTGKIQLTPSDLHTLRKEYATESSLITRGEPKYYAPGLFRPFPDTSLSAGIVTALTITTPGASYTAGTLSATGGGGTGFAGTYTVATVGGAIETVTITNAGSGYTSTPTIVISNAGNGAARVTATISAFSGMYDIEDLILGDAHYTYNGVVIMPPSDSTYTLEIFGLFYSPTLSATLSGTTWTQTKSYWTEVMPEILLEAALQRMEGFYRNTDGAKDFMNTLREDVQGLDYDAVEEDLVGNSQMGG